MQSVRFVCLEESGFCSYLLTLPSTPLSEVYDSVYRSKGVLSQLPADVLGCHLVAVLQGLRVLLRQVRARKSELDQSTVWDPKEGIQPIPSWEEVEVPWWEGLAESFFGEPKLLDQKSLCGVCQTPKDNCALRLLMSLF